MEVPRETQGSSMGDPDPWASIEIPQFFHGNIMGDLWQVHGSLVGIPWDSHGTPMGRHNKTRGVPWVTHGQTHGRPMGDSWDHRKPHGSIPYPWEPHGNTMGVQHMAVERKYCKPMEAPRVPWEIHGSTTNTWEQHHGTTTTAPWKKGPPWYVLAHGTPMGPMGFSWDSQRTFMGT